MPRAIALKSRRAVAWSIAVGSLLVATTAHASPEDLFGYGTRTCAMGATGTAHAEGYESAFHNPALASDVRRPKLSLGFMGAVFRLDAEGPGLPGRTSQSPAKGTIIGAELPIPFRGKLQDRVGIALGFYEPTDIVIRGRVLYTDKTQFPLLGERSQSLAIRVGLGANLGYGIRVGGGFAALAEIGGGVVAATDASGRVGTRVDDQLVAKYAPVVGASYDLPLKGPETWRIGAIYRGWIAARFSVAIDGTKLSSLSIPRFNIAGVGQYDPSQVAVEVARRTDDTVLAAQLVWKKWSAYPGVLEPTVVCADGGVGACGLLPPHIEYKDTFALHVGADRAFRLGPVRLHARGGAFYEQSPLPEAIPGSQAFDAASRQTVDVATRYFDADRVAFTVGTGVEFDALLPMTLDMFAQEHVLVPRTVRSSSDAGAALSEGDVSGHITVLGMTFGVKF